VEPNRAANPDRNESVVVPGGSHAGSASSAADALSCAFHPFDEM